MKTFIATLTLTLSLGVLANGMTTKNPGYTETTSEQQRMEETKMKMKNHHSKQQRMEETKMKMKNHPSEHMESVEKTTTKETPMMNHKMENDSTTIHKTKKMR